MREQLRRIAYVSLAVPAISFWITAAAHAQVLYGTLLGSVTDPSGSAVSEATVVALNGATGDVRNETTDNRGLYAFRNLQPGEYTLTIQAAGFSIFERRSIQISSNVDTWVDGSYNCKAHRRPSKFQEPRQLYKPIAVTFTQN
jgi:hypothetical protein